MSKKDKRGPVAMSKKDKRGPVAGKRGSPVAKNMNKFCRPAVVNNKKRNTSRRFCRMKR